MLSGVMAVFAGRFLRISCISGFAVALQAVSMMGSMHDRED